MNYRCGRAVPSRPGWWLLMVCVVLGLSGCRTLGFYGQAASGQVSLWWHRQPIQKLIDDPATPRPLVARLSLARQARQYASDHLDLPRNRSYTYFVQLPRPYVVWNVFATPAYSVDPVQYCFPVAGCVAYRGYFSLAGARGEARRLKAAGYDVYIGGVPAYSTLGWFADPVLSSMLRWSDDELAGTIFHELAHQKIYVAGDTAFNESYASFVEQQGIREWRQARGLSAPDPRAAELEDDLTRRVLQLRQELRVVYARPLSPAELSAAKQAAFADFRQRSHHWIDAQGLPGRGYRVWLDSPLNNASLLPFGLYDGWVPGFAHLFASVDGRWPAFYAAVRQWTRLPRNARDALLQQWTDAARDPQATKSASEKCFDHSQDPNAECDNHCPDVVGRTYHSGDLTPGQMGCHTMPCSGSSSRQ